MSVIYGDRYGYRDLFNDKPLDFKEYFKGIGKDDIEKITASFVNFASPNNEYQNPKIMVCRWFCNENRHIRVNLLGKINENNIIINILSSLRFLEFVKQSDFEEKSTKQDTEIEIDLFKAYLLLNTEQNRLEENIKKTLSQSDDIIELGHEEILALHFKVSDLTSYDIKSLMFIQFIKSVEFFKYIESTKELYHHLVLFLKKYNCNTWKEWLRRMLTIVYPIIEKDTTSYCDYTIPKDSNFESTCMFFDSLTINDKNDFSEKDFINLRNNPILRIDLGQYRILSVLFLVEKIFKSIQFKFSKEINEELPAEFQLKNFRSLHCDKFSEKILFCSVLQKTFPKKNWVHKSDVDFKNCGYKKGVPDYYIRFENKVFLFENKDVVLNGLEKQSYDYQKLKNALCEKFYKSYDGNKEKNEAVLQLVENIKRILEIYYHKCDKGYNPKNIKIYPILVVQDRQFDSLGLNQLILKWFNVELLKLKNDYNITNIKPITVVNIDTLIQYQLFFKMRGNNRIEKLISDYHEKIKVQPLKNKNPEVNINSILNSSQSFSLFMDNEIRKRKLKIMPLDLIEYLKELKEEKAQTG